MVISFGCAWLFWHSSTALTRTGVVVRMLWLVFRLLVPTIAGADRKEPKWGRLLRRAGTHSLRTISGRLWIIQAFIPVHRPALVAFCLLFSLTVEVRCLEAETFRRIKTQNVGLMTSASFLDFLDRWWGFRDLETIEEQLFYHVGKWVRVIRYTIIYYLHYFFLF